ncbi:hypothetical protein TRVA0_053S00804 [Trichomonascus vanleenenianus]|uniref:Aim25p n=1 Tax=Trichomonascus vanleenenianus TaxID=2268995 RepID=UPI003ECB959A
MIGLRMAARMGPQLRTARFYSSMKTNADRLRRHDLQRLRNSIEERRRRMEQEPGQPVWEYPEDYGYYQRPEVPNPNGVLQAGDAVVELLSQPTLVMERQMEYMNLFLGFEQANRYAVLDPNGTHLGYMEEEDFGFTKAILRQVYRLHRPFSVRVYDRHGSHVMTIRRPFSFINSHIKAILPAEGHEDNAIVIGETKQQWHLWRRRYNLFLSDGPNSFDQFGRVDAPFLSFAFPVQDAQGNVLATVDRNWVGIGRELFTDTGVYVLRMDPSSFAGLENVYPNVAGPLTLDQRAVMLGTAVSIDFDFFSRHSNHRGGFFSFGDYD